MRDLASADTNWLQDVIRDGLRLEQFDDRVPVAGGIDEESTPLLGRIAGRGEALGDVADPAGDVQSE